METFSTWQEAFDVCRERNKPMIASVGDETAKIFPSGRFFPKNAAAKIAAHFEPTVKAAVKIR